MTLLVGGGVFVLTLVAGLIGLALHRALPEDHRSGESKDTVRLVQALIASMATLVLGLLIASASTHYRNQAEGVSELAADVLVLDIALAHAGPQADVARRELRGLVETAVRHHVLETRQTVPAIETARFDAFHDAVVQMHPADAGQAASQARALDMAGRLVQARVLLMMHDATNEVQWPFLTVLVSWLAMLFLAMGVFARANRIIVVAFIAGALAVSGAIFLILELEHPRIGLLRVSDLPLRFALQQLGHWHGSTVP